MEIWDVFFHLTFSFLLVTSIMRMSRLARVCQIGALLSLGSYFSMNTESQVQWQLWSVSIFFLHLVLWNKRSMSEKSDFDGYEHTIWDDWFNELDEREFQQIIEYSHWEEYSRSGQVNIEKNQLVLDWKEQSSWRNYRVGERLYFEKHSLFFIIDVDLMNEEAKFLYTKIIQIISERKDQDIAA